MTGSPKQKTFGWISDWVHQDGAAISAVAFGAVVVFAGWLWYVGPNRGGASVAISGITSDLVVVQQEEERAIVQYAKYRDPAPLFVKQAKRSGRTDATVLTSFADQSHWFLKVRHSATRTVCVHLGTLNDSSAPKPACREASQDELAEVAMPVVAIGPQRVRQAEQE